MSDAHFDELSERDSVRSPEMTKTQRKFVKGFVVNVFLEVVLCQE